VPATKAIAPAMLNENWSGIAVTVVIRPWPVEGMMHDDHRSAHHHDRVSLRTRHAAETQEPPQRYRRQCGLLPHRFKIRQLHKTSFTTLAVTRFL